MFLCCQVLYPHHHITFKCKEALINIGNSKKCNKSSTKHCNSKNFCILRNVLRNVFFLQKFILREFSYCPRVFTLTKILNTALTPT